MSQGNLFTPTTGTVTGLALSNNINTAIAALTSQNSGSSAPTNTIAGTPTLGQLWLDTSASPNKLKMWDGSSTWVVIGAVDPTNHVWAPPIGGGVTTLASATTTDLGSVNQAAVTVSGVTTITSLGSGAATGIVKVVTFSGALILTHNSSSLILPTAANITTVAGDVMLALCISSGNWRVVAYQKADGSPLLTSGTIGGSFQFTGIISPGALAANQNDFAPTGNATATIWRLSTNGSSYTLTGISGGTNGRILTIQNVNAAAGGNISIAAQSTSSSAANRLSAPADITLRPGEARIFLYDSTASRWTLVTGVGASGAWGSFKNLTVANNSGTPNSIMDVAADQLILEDADGNTLRLRSVAQSPNMGTSGAGGLDTGAEANSTWYSIWIIYNPATGTTSSLFSLSTTAPTMPSGYTFKMRVGWVFNDGSSNFLRITQAGRQVQYVVGTNPANTVILASGATGTFSVTSPVLSSVSIATVAPPTASKISISAYGIWKGGSGGSILVAPNTAWGGTNNGPEGSNGNVFPINTVSAGGARVGCQAWIQPEAAAIAWCSSAAGTALGCLGWEDGL